MEERHQSQPPALSEPAVGGVSHVADDLADASLPGNADGHRDRSSASAAAEGAIVAYDAEEAARLEEQLAREQAELSMIKAVLGSVFSVRRPRDVVAGTSSGLKTVARGVGLGLASLVVQPYMGAKAGGVKGLAKGVGAGFVTCAASTCGGVAVGSAQIVRGVANTPGAILHKARGQVWNAENRVWEKDWYSLPEEAAEVLGASAATAEGDDKIGDPTASSGAAGQQRLNSKRVLDRTLYDLLDVEPEANESQIRRAFYKKSLQYHPDKNPDNPEATQKFQAVSEAYRVLGDEDRRKVYDEHGQESAIAGMPKIEPMVFFAALFGSHHFEPFVGRLRLAQEVDGDLQSLLREAVASSEDDPNIGLDALKVVRAHERIKVVQREREVKCAVELAKLLASVVDAPAGDTRVKARAEWDADRRQQCEHLEKAPCGPEMLYLIGWVYTNRARQFFAGGVAKRVLAKVEGKVHLTQSKAKLAGTMGRTCFRVNGVVKKFEKKKSLEEKQTSRNAEKDAGGGDTTTGASKQAEEVAAEADASAGPPPHNQPPAPPIPVDEPELAAAMAGADEVDEASAAAGLAAGQNAVDLRPGSVVMVHGLKSSPELNDEVGVVCHHDAAKDRYLVQLLSETGSGGVKALKADNLLLLQAPADAEGFRGAGTDAPSASGAEAPGADGKGDTGATGQDGQWAPGGDDAEMATAMKDCMPLFHDSLWSATSLDIELTLSRVVQKVLRDMSVDKATRRRRAEVLLSLGLIFQEPMREQRRKAKAEVAKPAALQDASAPQPNTSRQSGTSTNSTEPEKRPRRSVLARFKQPFSRSSRRSNEAKDCQKARDAEAKRKRMEGALAMMAAGASTEDVDDMIAARAAMEAEFGEEVPFL